ncbi:unnamed protein product [Phytophthora fragariaefolia]|uniref:Unnamed protein product n=1 Tax=Phytophthora fragariaefolia TaxID=1490495 RepID=A0A9W6Y6C9_9STRA|nr:unnamed protein product [Phytophthora fragariaefolia]
MEALPTAIQQNGRFPTSEANIAMSTQRSIEVTAADIPRLPHRWNPVVSTLIGDIAHWVDNIPDREDNSPHPP